MEQQQQQPDNLTLITNGLQRLEGEQKAFKEEHIKALAELKATVLKEVEEKTAKGYDSPETKAKIHNLEEAISKMEAAMLAPGAAQTKSDDFVSPGRQLTSDKDFLEWKETGFRATKGNSGRQFPIKGGFFPIVDPWGEKATLATSGVSTATQRQAGIIQLPRQELRIRDIMAVRQLTTGNTVDYLKQNVFTNVASPQVEASAKHESEISYTTATATVRTLAHFISVTRQALDDVPGLRADIDDLLLYGLKLVEERQILTGSGTGQNLNGIITQATAYNTGLNVSGDTRLDKIRHMILQVRLALFPCDGIVVNPTDMHHIELIKDQASNVGNYVIGNPRTGVEMTTLWGKPVVESDSITAGQALVGAFRTGAELFDRMMAMVDISFEHASNFTENKATILAEERLALAVKRANSFVTGTIS